MADISELHLVTGMDQLAACTFIWGPEKTDVLSGKT
ncbi:hypothetical protein T05_13450 [Trichinella murrelli]|uniref:Uncharacterized protein n=1 Tax=Trichinella murrelli TaxID=144512 RepID=A0A0V0SWL9_9BILA|nr:hypothetical protein T05_13450 [Trichinella murrelli]